MQTTLENRKKATIDSPKNVLKRKNKIEEERAYNSRVKREQESMKAKAQKMMKGRLEPSTMPTMVHVARQTIEVPQMTSPQEGQLREQR